MVVPQPGASFTEEAVIRRTRGPLAGCKTPKRVVIADAIPIDPRAKILKQQLQEDTRTSPQAPGARKPSATCVRVDARDQDAVPTDHSPSDKPRNA